MRTENGNCRLGARARSLVYATEQPMPNIAVICAHIRPQLPLGYFNRLWNTPPYALTMVRRMVVKSFKEMSHSSNWPAAIRESISPLISLSTRAPSGLSMARMAASPLSQIMMIAATLVRGVMPWYEYSV